MTKLNTPIAAHKYIDTPGTIRLTHIRRAQDLQYWPDGQEGPNAQGGTRIYASADGRYYRWYIEQGADYRPEIKRDSKNYVIISDYQHYELEEM